MPSLARTTYSPFRQGGLKRHLDESIPLKYNVIGQETIGPGGFFFAMRNVPVIRGDPGGGWRSLRPRQCWSTTATPQIVAEAVTRFTDVPCISICDRCSDDQKTILRALNRPDARVTLEWIGLNHATWSTLRDRRRRRRVGNHERHLDGCWPART
ncbi:MAG: hypothetical protein R2873_34890 [Caldilineaceae bacterium]